MLNKTVCLIGKVSGGVHAAGVAVLAAMMFLIFADVMMRYVFNRPITGTLELNEYMQAILIAFGMAYCAVLKGHVSIDIIVSKFPQRAQAVIDSITCIFGLGVFSLITWQTALYVKEELDTGIESMVLGIPSFPFVGAVALGSALFSLVLMTHLVEFLSRAVKK